MQLLVYRRPPTNVIESKTLTPSPMLIFHTTVCLAIISTTRTTFQQQQQQYINTKYFWPFIFTSLHSFVCFRSIFKLSDAFINSILLLFYTIRTENEFFFSPNFSYSFISFDTVEVKEKNSSNNLCVYVRFMAFFFCQSISAFARNVAIIFGIEAKKKKIIRLSTSQNRVH